MKGVEECIRKIPLGVSVSDNKVVRLGIFSSLIAIYIFLYVWGYGKGTEALDMTLYGDVIRLEKILGAILGFVLLTGWIILPMFKSDLVFKNTILIYGIGGLMMGVTSIMTSLSIIKEDQRLYGDNNEPNQTFEAWSQIRLIVFCLFCILGILLVSKGSEEGGGGDSGNNSNT